MTWPHFHISGASESIYDIFMAEKCHKTFIAPKNHDKIATYMITA